jgi:hypothetical protein
MVRNFMLISLMAFSKLRLDPHPRLRHLREDNGEAVRVCPPGVLALGLVALIRQRQLVPQNLSDVFLQSISGNAENSLKELGTQGETGEKGPHAALFLLGAFGRGSSG